MKKFLEKNGPWSQLINLNNIKINCIQPNQVLKLSKNLSIIPFLVPHRNEYSETCGFKIIGPNKSVLFIPDIDKWSIWGKNLITEIEQVDIALIDGTFYNKNELKTRNVNKIPHPFVTDTMNLFKNKPNFIKNKIHFIHFNHTNPLLNKTSKEYKDLIDKGFNISNKNDQIKL